MTHIAIVYFDAGSGHRSAARGLESAIGALRPDWRVRAVNIVDVFAPNRRFRRVVQAGIDYFNWCLKRERVFDLGGLVNLSLLCHDLVRPAGVARIAAFWRDDPPDAVVSVTPMYNPLLYRSARLANPGVACITIPVDFEEFKPRYWYTPRVEQHYFVATERLADQARASGAPPALIHRLGGMIIDPTFYSAPPTDIRGEIARLGLDPGRPTGLVSFGGQGSVVVRDIARQLADAICEHNMIFLCGRNQAVFEAVRDMPTSYRKLVLAYAEEPPHYYHHLADFVIGKPGSMTITEALVTHTPLIFIKSRGMAPVQRGNEAWVLQHSVGVQADRLADLPALIARVLQSHCYRASAARESHRGVFDAATTIATLLEPARARGAALA